MDSMGVKEVKLDNTLVCFSEIEQLYSSRNLENFVATLTHRYCIVWNINNYSSNCVIVLDDGLFLGVLQLWGSCSHCSPFRARALQ